MGTLNLGSNGKINGHAEFEGRVTKPAHPYMFLRPNSGVTVNHNSHTKISTMFGTTEINQGGIALDTSNGRITFPVVGIYKIRSKVNAASEAHWGNDNQFYMKLNGTTYPHSQVMYGATQKAGGERKEKTARIMNLHPFSRNRQNFLIFPAIHSPYFIDF